MNTERTIIHMDMDAFFASVEQRCDPRLKGKAIAIVGSAKRTVVTTASYEARARGVRTGMNRFEAKGACPELIFVVGDNRKYIDTSVRVFDILRDFSPRVEPYSIDEAFVDITGTSSLLGPPARAAREMKRRVLEDTGLTCSIGIAPNKLISKLASGMEKPDGLVEIRPEEVRALLEELPVNELWGIGPALTKRLGAMGIRTSGELGRCPPGVLRSRFGIIGETLARMGQGVDDSRVRGPDEEPEAKSVGHSTTLPTDISDRAGINRYLLKLSEKVGRRARRYALKGRKVCLTVRYRDFYTFTRTRTLPVPTNDTRTIYLNILGIVNSVKLRAPVRLLGVSVSGIVKDLRQIPLFEEERKRERLLRSLDAINDRFGEAGLMWGSTFEKKEGPGVISPAWRPVGVKRVDVK